MDNRTTAITVFVILCVICVIHALYYYPQLPEMAARHFDASGQPDVRGNKMQVFVMYLVTVFIMAVTFLGFGLLLPHLSHSVINVPNKDYWLAPERRQQTLNYLVSRFLWLGSFTLILLLVIFEQSFQVHLGPATQLSYFWIAIGVYLTLTIFVCIALHRKFKNVAS